MKEPVNHSSQEELDRLLFEYLEGTLPSAEEGKLEERLLSDSLLEEELESWQESFVTQDFYPTKALEKKILANTPTRFTYLRVGAAALLGLSLFISLFYFFGFEEAAVERLVQESKKVVATEPVPTEEPVDKIAGNNQKSAPDQPRQTVVAEVQERLFFTKAVPEQKPEKKKQAAPAFMQGALPEPEKLLPKLEMIPIPPLELPLRMEKVKIQAERAIFAISKKEQRKINRMKRKSQEKRMAREFIKGNHPYVVPLNTQNF